MVRFRIVPSPKLRLFAFSYAGGGASIYRRWQDDVPPGIEVVGVQLPGRQSRIQEPPILEFNRLVQEIANAMLPYRDTPFLFFGHSLGALIAFETARAIRARDAFPNLRALVVSACAAPHLRTSKDDWCKLSNDELIIKLRELNGTPPEILNSPELLDLVLPAIRADFFLAGSYRYDPQRYPHEIPLNVPIHVFAGERDGLRDANDDGITETQLAGWQHYTAAATSLNVFPGDHFFISTDHEQVLGIINKLIEELLPCPVV